MRSSRCPAMPKGARPAGAKQEEWKGGEEGETPVRGPRIWWGETLWDPPLILGRGLTPNSAILGHPQTLLSSPPTPPDQPVKKGKKDRKGKKSVSDL